MNFKIDKELKIFLREYANENKLSMSNVLNQLVLKLKRENEKENNYRANL